MSLSPPNSPEAHVCLITSLHNEVGHDDAILVNGNTDLCNTYTVNYYNNCGVFISFLFEMK